MKGLWLIRHALSNLVFVCGAAVLLRDARGQVVPDDLTVTAPVSTPLVEAFDRIVPFHLTVPVTETNAYAALLNSALAAAGIHEASQKFVVLVDRNPNIEALLVFWGTVADGWSLVGASSISTGLPGKFEHFTTPLGVFDHSRENPDFRAEGTKNKFGIRGYGNKGGRIYDFGWVKAPRGWGDGHMGELRLQMHSTDADLLEQRLGTAQSEGCVRMPAELNEFIDRYAILDEDYDRVVAVGAHPWVLRDDRLSTPWSGRYLVVVESAAAIRPSWAPSRKNRR